MEKTLKEKQLDLLNETISFFNLGNRCIGSDSSTACFYYYEGKEGCAIGRKIEDKELCKSLDKEGAVTRNYVFNLLPDNLKELGQDFLINVQGLHDTISFWTKTGLSEKGEEKVIEIKNEFELN